MSSIQDVAKKAKVGVGTVSRVLNGNGYVADATRKKVEKAIKELNYKPNELARNLLHNKTNIIAVIIPDVANPFFATLVTEIEKELRKNGYKTMLCNTVGESTNEEAYLDMLERNMVDGVLTGTHSLDYSHYVKLNRPIVAFDTESMGAGKPIITVDHTNGGYLAAKSLLDAGCKEVIQFTDDTVGKGDFPFLKRHQEFRRVIEENGGICHDYVVAWNEFDNEYYQKVVEDGFSKYPSADGVFGTDTIALLYMKCALQNGKNIPEDIKIVAYDGTSIIDMVYPTITVVAQPIEELAIAGVNQLLKIIRQEPLEQEVTLFPVELREGMTTQKS